MRTKKVNDMIEVEQGLLDSSETIKLPHMNLVKISYIYFNGIEIKKHYFKVNVGDKLLIKNNPYIVSSTIAVDEITTRAEVVEYEYPNLVIEKT